MEQTRLGAANLRAVALARGGHAALQLRELTAQAGTPSVLSGTSPRASSGCHAVIAPRMASSLLNHAVIRFQLAPVWSRHILWPCRSDKV